MHIVCPHPHNLFRSIHIHFLSAAQERCWAMNEIEAKKLKSLFIFFYFLHRKTNLKPSFQSPNLQVDWLDKRKGEKKNSRICGFLGPHSMEISLGQNYPDLKMISRESAMGISKREVPLKFLLSATNIL